MYAAFGWFSEHAKQSIRKSSEKVTIVFDVTRFQHSDGSIDYASIHINVVALKSHRIDSTRVFNLLLFESFQKKEKKKERM